MAPDLPSNGNSFFTYGAALLTAMADRNRLLILRSLLNGDMSLNSLAMRTGVNRLVCAQELDTLQAAGLVHRRVVSSTAYFCCRSDYVRKVLIALDDLPSEAPFKRQGEDRS